MRNFTLIAALLTLPTFAAAHEYKVENLVVDHPVARETAKTALTGAGYLTITNNGDAPDSLIAVEADFPRVMIHDTKVENDVATMFHIDAIEIAPGETLTLAPGGKHVMFMGLDGDPFETGEAIPATLVFEKAGRLDVNFNVETLQQITETLGEGSGADDHGEHANHDDHANHADEAEDHSNH